MEKAENGFAASVKRYFTRLFIDGLSGMALGLFATLIVGTIISQLGEIIAGIDVAFVQVIGKCLVYLGKTASVVTGAGIGCGVAYKLKQQPLVIFSAAVCGFVGAFASYSAIVADKCADFGLGKPGNPLTAFIAADICIEVGRLVAGRTKLDIVLTPLAAVISGGAAAILLGDPLNAFVRLLGEFVSWGTGAQPFVAGVIVSVSMGIFLTLPISSAAIGFIVFNATAATAGMTDPEAIASVTRNLGIAAGAATVGCCANMVGFAVSSYRENKLGGLIAQGLGTSMLQMPNIVKKPIIWLPAILSSAILGPVSTLLFKMTNSAGGSGMGTAGLVGPILSFTDMLKDSGEPWLIVVKILVLYIILPGGLSLLFSEIMRKLGWIKYGDMKLDI